MLVPDGAPTINAAINAAAHDGVVLVRPGLYSESVRVTRDLTLCGPAASLARPARLSRVAARLPPPL